MADSSSRVRCTGIAWHPDVATQMVTASGDDRAPVIQVCTCNVDDPLPSHITNLTTITVFSCLDQKPFQCMNVKGKAVTCALKNYMYMW